MAKPAKRNDDDRKTERLRTMRMAQEKSRREAGTWGDMSVGEVVHAASASAFVHFWKGRRRPDPFHGLGARAAGFPSSEWMAMIAWINDLKATGFSERIVAWDLSGDEARKIADERITALRAEGLTVLNPPTAAKKPRSARSRRSE